MIIWSYFYISVWSFIRVALLDADTRRISKAKMEASAVLAVLGNVYKYIYIYYTYIIHLFYIYNIHILWILYCVYTNYILKGQLGIWMWHWVAALWRLVLVGWTVCSMSFLGGWTRASWLHCARNFNAWQVFQTLLLFNFCPFKFSERAFIRYHPRLCSRSPKRCWADIAWGAMDQPTAANSCLLGLRPQWKCFLNWFDSNLELILFELSNATHWEVFSAKLANSLFVFLSLRYLCDG